MDPISEFPTTGNEDRESTKKKKKKKEDDVVTMTVKYIAAGSL
jgi:hypothetical protein